MGLEVEIKFNFMGSDWDGIYGKLLALNELSDLTIDPPVTRHHRDIYWDTPDHILEDKKITLRVRTNNHRHQLCVKYDINQRDGLFVRKEVETELTPAGWSEIVLVLKDLDIDLPRTLNVAQLSVPAAGELVPTVVCNTVRISRSMYGANEELAATMTIDEVSYDGFDRLFYYVELELSETSNVDPAQLGAAFMAMFPGQWQPAKISKHKQGLDLKADR